MDHPPASLQGTLWSSPVQDLDIRANRAYIIHQILAFGTLADLRWLFRTYDVATIRQTFVNAPIKIYTRPAFHFSKLLLGITDWEAPTYRYDASLPRSIG